AHMAGRPLKEVGVPKGVVLVMGQRGQESFIPNGETVFQAGDKLTAMGSMSGINRLVTRWLADRSSGPDPRRAAATRGGA
ncbi:MAG: TrkA C-terminal domain-containing protein, partial [Longimicrobiales bacterium]